MEYVDRDITIKDKPIQEEYTVAITLKFDNPHYIGMVIQDFDFTGIHINLLKYQVTIISLIRPIDDNNKLEIERGAFGIFDIPYKLFGMAYKPRKTLHLTCKIRRIGGNVDDPARQFFIKRNDLE